MTRRTAFLYSDAFLNYDLGPQHPLQQRRLRAVRDQLERRGALDVAGGPIALIEPTPVEAEALLRVHTPEFVDAVRRAGDGERGPWLNHFGLGAGDTPAFDGMFDASRLYVGATVDAAKLVASGEYAIAINFSGGLHHAFPGRASGFCTFNDLAMGIRTLQDAGFAKVAYVDIDVHHGDGVEACFWNDASVLTISLHESGRWLFPGTGRTSDRGGPDAYGTAVNVPFAPHTRDAVWRGAFEAAVPTALEAFAPDAFVLQLGADAHRNDPLAHLELTSRGWVEAVVRLLELAAGKPIVLTGGGGYHLDTVERLWTLAALAAAGLPEPDDLHDASIPPRLPPEVDEATQMYARAQIDELRAA